MTKQGNRLDEIRVRLKSENAIVFLHGFVGDKDETWDRFTWILKGEENLDEWDILSLGYAQACAQTSQVFGQQILTCLCAW